MYRKICVTNRALAERPFLEQLACVLATKPYAMILREKDLTEEGYEELAGKVKKLCENTDTRLILHSFPEVCSSVKIPVYAIGGINDKNAASCIREGAAGVCVMSGYMRMR